MSSQDESRVLWQIRDMFFCRGDLNKSKIKYDGEKSIIKVAGGNKVRELHHGIRYVDLSTAEFMLEFGSVSPGIKWEVGARPLAKRDDWRPLMSGQGGGTHRAPLSKLGLQKWVGADITLRFWSEEPGTMEVLRWSVITPKKVRFYDEHQEARKQLAKAKATPLERGIVPHWNPIIGGFVCAYNYTHPEHYNYWLEDEGEQLWSLGNFPEMMKLYGKGLRDFIVDHCRHGAPVRRINDQPLTANPYLTDGKFEFDTGLLNVNGDLAKDPHIDIHHGTYEYTGLIASLGDFYFTYKKPDGSTSRLDFTKPVRHRVEYNMRRPDSAHLSVRSDDDVVMASFDIEISGGRTWVIASITNISKQPIHNVVAGFALRDCEKYYKHPPNTVKEFGEVALIYSEQPKLEDCNLVRIAGPAAKNLRVQRTNESIEQVGVSFVLADELPAGKPAALNIAAINAGSTSFAAKIDNYKDVDFEDADISMSYVGTYALLGLAVYSYRFPEDKEARESVNMMIDNFIMARDKARDRELGYLLWVLALYGRDKDMNLIADLLEKRVKGRKFNSLDGSAICMGFRNAGRWAIADKIGNEIDPLWEEGVAPPTDLIGLGILQSPATSERAYLQLSRSLWMMYWDEPDRITTHNNRFVEEGPQETNCYMLVGLDLISRLYGGITPIRLDFFAQTLITSLNYDEKSGKWKLGLTKAGDVDLFTHFRAPQSITWKGRKLASNKWRYSEDTGVIYITGIKGDGELVVTVEGAPPREDPNWKPIDYIGSGRKLV
ncbi:MAG: hypothetical protein Q7N50_08065 [Armatimonadota bacterium]|nr:hypothetical protein [Armatimonadota bacterium]